MAALKDRVVLVTGASSGIGRATALRLAADGACVIVHGRDERRLAAVAGEIAEGGGIAIEAPGDLTVEEEVESVIATAVGAFGRLDSVVNNAGAALRDRPVDRTLPEEWDRMLDVNLRAVYQVSRRAVAEMRRCGEGCFVHVASNLGLVGLPGLAGYSAAKGAVISLTRSMAVDLGPEGIRVNCVCPGLVATPMNETLPDIDEKRRAYAEAAPLRRTGQPEDVAGVVAFLLGPDAAWMTGQSIVVDGGYTIQ